VLIRAAAWLALLTIIVLSVVPGEIRPQTMHDKHFEHFAAYCITGGMFAAGYPRLRQVASYGIMLTLCAGSMEIVQLWIPGRTPAAGDFLASIVAAWIGLLVVWCFGWIRGRDPVPTT
jgi:VanZ family protein